MVMFFPFLFLFFLVCVFVVTFVYTLDNIIVDSAIRLLIAYHSIQEQNSHFYHFVVNFDHLDFTPR